jgi:hypothetical protein
MSTSREYQSKERKEGGQCQKITKNVQSVGSNTTVELIAVQNATKANQTKKRKCSAHYAKQPQ